MTRTVLMTVGGGVAVALLGGYFVGALVAERALETARSDAYTAVREQAGRLGSFSEVMARGGVDEVVGKIVTDCSAPDRSRFDAQLARLGEGLSASELDELSRLYDRCGTYFARGKALMTVRFEREVELYAELIARYEQLINEEQGTTLGLATWREIARLEGEQRALFERLVIYQGRIIDTLIAGTAIDAPPIIEMLGEVREVVEMQTYNTIQLSNLRGSIPSL